MVPKAGEPKLPFGSLKGGVFDRLKNLCSKFQVGPFCNAKRLPQHQVCVLQTGASHWIPGAASDRELRRKHKSRGLEPLRSAPIRQSVGVAYTIRPLCAIPEVGIGVGGLGDCDRISRLHPDQACNLPAGNFPQARNLICPSAGEDPRNIPVGEVPFQMAIITVGHAGVGNRTGEDRVRKNAGSVIDQLRKSICEWALSVNTFRVFKKKTKQPKA